jgi:iron complex transport system ATP-binding protein
MNSVIDIRNISLSLHDKDILSDVSFKVDTGEFFIIIGPNGAGKTSLLKALNNLHSLNQGSISVKGKELASYSRRTLAQTMAIVPQQIEVGFPFTVKETVIMGRTPHLGILGLESEQDYKICEEAMRFTDVYHLAERKLSQLSGGELQRAIIARALCQQPEIVLLDEPTTALDPAHQLKTMDLMDKFRNEKNTTIIMVSHDLNLASLYGDRILLLNKGKTVKTGTPQSVLEKSLLEESYGCRMMVDVGPLGENIRVTPVPEKHIS